MDLLRLTNKLSQTQMMNQASGLRKSIRDMPPIAKVLLKLFLRRQRYTFQLLKYFVLFPGSSQMSEDISIDSYDRLIFGDDAIHSMVKIYEVKQIQNKIWAFINIKALKYLQTCKLFSEKVTKIYVQKFQKPVKKDVFKTFKQYDIHVKIEAQNKLNQKAKLVDRQTNTQHRDKLVQNPTLYEVKIQGKNYYNSKIAILSGISSNGKSNLQQNTRHIDEAKLTQSQNLAQDLNIVIESKVSEKSNNNNSQNQQLSQHKQKINKKSLSNHKIKFTYTSPTKQQIKLSSQRQKSLSKIRKNQQALKKSNQNQYQNQYKYQVPKNITGTNNCCQNYCGCSCCMANCNYSKAKK